MAEQEEQIVPALVSKEQLPSLLLKINSTSLRQALDLLNGHCRDVLVYLWLY